MAGNRYAKDYRLVETIDERGRIETVRIHRRPVASKARRRLWPVKKSRDRALPAALAAVFDLDASEFQRDALCGCGASLCFHRSALRLSDGYRAHGLPREGALGAQTRRQGQQQFPPSALAASVLTQLVRALKGG